MDKREESSNIEKEQPCCVGLPDTSLSSLRKKIFSEIKQKSFRKKKSGEKMHTFYCEYEILDHARDDCMTFFGGMTPADDAKELGKVKLLGRWSTAGEGRGFCIAQARDAKEVQDWLFTWVSMANIKVYPILDDNEARRIILGKQPSYQVDYSRSNSVALPGETLYFINYKFQEGKRMEGFAAFANLTEKEDQQDAGNNTCFGRWHNLGTGSGVAICSSPSVEDVYTWAFHWAAICDCEITPVTTDAECRDVIKGKPDFPQKHRALMEKMGLAQ